MAIIQKIRDKYAKLAGFVIVLALIGFVLTDLGRGGGNMFSDSTSIGKVNGEKIDNQTFFSKLDQTSKEYRQQRGEVDPNTEAQLRDQVWDEMVTDIIMGDIQEKLGITVTKNELMDMFTGINPAPQVVQAFTNPQTGQFNPQEVAQIYQEYEKTNDPALKDQWNSFKKQLVAQRLQEKFSNLISHAVYTPKAILDAQHKDRNTLADIDYVALPYALVGDNEVTVTDKEINDFVSIRKKMFENKYPTRDIEYVSFNLMPSAMDTANMNVQLDSLKTQFASTTNDTFFVHQHSEVQIPIAYQNSQTLQNFPNSSEVLNAPTGSVVGPFFQDNAYWLAKVINKKSLPDSVKARHILVMTNDRSGQALRTEAEAKALIDSVVAMVKAGANFDTLVARYSDDEGSKFNGGAITFPLAQRGQLAPEFGDFVFEGKTGDKNIIKTGFGYHYVENLNSFGSAPNTQLAFVVKRFTPSELTNQNTYATATEFATQASDGENAFQKSALQHNATPMKAFGLNINSNMVPNLGASPQLIKWAYEAKINEVSPIFIVNGNYVIANLSGINEAGLPKQLTGQAKMYVENEIKKHKKAQLLIERNGSKGSLTAIAEGQSQTVISADSISLFSGGMTPLNGEPRVLGYAFDKNLAPNTLSKGIEGNNGVYFIQVKNRNENSNNAPRDIVMEQRMSEMMIKNSAAQLLMQSLILDADIKDMRNKFRN